MNKEDVVEKINYDDIHFQKEDAENALFESFATFEQSKRLKELGFQLLNPRFFYNEFGDFSGFRIGMSSSSTNQYYQAPTLEQVCKLLRSEELFVQVCLNRIRNMYYNEIFETKCNGRSTGTSELFDTYEQAQSAGIDVALGLLEHESEKITQTN